MDMQNQPRTADLMRKVAKEARETIIVKPYLDKIEEAAHMGYTYKHFDVRNVSVKNIEAVSKGLKALGYTVKTIEIGPYQASFGLGTKAYKLAVYW